MSQKKFKILKLWVKVFLITLLIVFLIRSFFIQSYTVSFSQMETALLKGDKVLVNKESFGIRMPITILTIPFSFDSFYGLKSYSDLIQLDYYRLFPKMVDRNDVVLFNSPLEVDKPLDKRSLFLSRCVAIPGDTINVDDWDYFINGNRYVFSPDLLLSFNFKKENTDSVFFLMEKLNIEKRELKVDSVSTYITLNRYEAFLINQNLSDSNKILLNKPNRPSYKLVVPSKNMTVELNDLNIKLYNYIISEEEKKNDVRLEHNQLVINDSIITSYTFKNNYYWFLSDNVENATDSRSFGFIPEPNVIGKASLIWYSSDHDGLRKDRILKSIK